MSKPAIPFTLNGCPVTAMPGETLWQVALRHGVSIPHLCHRNSDGYRPDGNCRACLVEIQGETRLAPSCWRHPEPGMIVRVDSPRAVHSRRMVFELLLTDFPTQPPDYQAPLLEQARAMGQESSRFPRQAEEPSSPDYSHPAMSVDLQACIHCGLCVRACREVQVNDVIGLGGSGTRTRVVFDLDDPMGDSSCVGCGECVSACPTGALLERQRAPSDHPPKQVRSVCPYCGVGCQVVFDVSDNRIQRVEGAPGPANRQRLCVKGRFGFDYVHSPERLVHPLIRRPDAPKGINVDPANPLSHFRPASWDEALDTAANGFSRLRDLHGGDTLAGFGSAKCSNEEAYLFQKLIRSAFGSNHVDHCTRLCHASSVAALLEGIGSAAVTAPFTTVEQADVILVTGANPPENHPVAASFFKQAVRRGARLIVMDPRAHSLARHATHMLQFRPGSDVALLNAMMHCILDEGLQDKAYIERHTHGFERLRDHVAAYSPEKMAPVCGIPAERIREAARTYAHASAAITFWGMGVSQHVHGTDNARCLIGLALLCGHVGRPGTGLHPLRGQNNVQGASDAGLIPMFLPDYRPVSDNASREHLERLWGVPLSPQPGLTVTEILNAAHSGKIRGMYIAGENPAMSDPDASHARTALARLEHLVVQDIFLTETAMFADVVLPAAAWPEKSGTVTNTNRQVQMGRQAIDPPGDARPDHWIIQQMARRMGLDWNYSGPAEIHAEMQQAMPSLDNIDWDRLEREHSVTYPCPDANGPGEEIVFGTGFPTADGRARFVPATPCPPDEQPDDDYPLILVTGRQLEHWHTGAMTRRSQVLDALEPGPTLNMSPQDMRALGLEPGSPVDISSRRGVCRASIRQDPAIPAGMVFLPFAYVEAAANLLTNPAIDPIGKIPEFKFCAVQLNPVLESV